MNRQKQDLNKQNTFHFLFYTRFTCFIKQTSVAVISPSQAKSVRSLSVCICRPKRNIPRCKGEKEEGPSL